jgi:predicted nicotinamide N-methyase
MREAADGASTYLKTGTAVWDGALLLADHLLSHEPEAVRGARVLEVGAGTGLVGLMLARGGADVCLTDGSSHVLRCAKCNMEMFREQRVGGHVGIQGGLKS